VQVYIAITINLIRLLPAAAGADFVKLRPRLKYGMIDHGGLEGCGIDQ